MEAFLVWGWDIIIPWWRWIYEYQVEVSTPWGGGIDPGDHRFRPRFVGVWKDL